MQTQNPFMLGLSEFEDMLLQITKSAQGFPPYNLEKLHSGGILLSLAVAGYTQEELEVLIEDNKLIIKGKKSDKETHAFIHQGIAARSFIKSFLIMDQMQVKEVILENGLLMIQLLPPKEKTLVKIPIQSRQKKVAL